MLCNENFPFFKVKFVEILQRIYFFDFVLHFLSLTSIEFFVGSFCQFVVIKSVAISFVNSWFQLIESQFKKLFLSDALSSFLVRYFFIVFFHLIVSRLLLFFSKTIITSIRVTSFLLHVRFRIFFRYVSNFQSKS